MKTFTSPYHPEPMETESDDDSSTSSEESDDEHYHNIERAENIEPEKEEPMKPHSETSLTADTRVPVDTLVMSHLRHADIEKMECI